MESTKIKAVEKWDKHLVTPYNYLLGEYPRIMDNSKDKYWLRLPVNSEQLFHDWEEPKENVEIVSTFLGWLEYLKIPRCYYCDEITSEEYLCEGGCGELYCESCSAQITYHSFIEKNCCESCQESIKWREDEY